MCVSVGMLYEQYNYVKQVQRISSLEGGGRANRKKSHKLTGLYTTSDNALKESKIPSKSDFPLRTVVAAASTKIKTIETFRVATAKYSIA